MKSDERTVRDLLERFDPARDVEVDDGRAESVRRRILDAGRHDDEDLHTPLPVDGDRDDGKRVAGLRRRRIAVPLAAAAIIVLLAGIVVVSRLGGDEPSGIEVLEDSTDEDPGTPVGFELGMTTVEGPETDVPILQRGVVNVVAGDVFIEFVTPEEDLPTGRLSVQAPRGVELLVVDGTQWVRGPRQALNDWLVIDGVTPRGWSRESWVRLPPVAQVGNVDEEWGSDPRIDVLHVFPRRLDVLSVLRQHADVRDLGVEDVRGEPTTHHTADVALDGLYPILYGLDAADFERLVQATGGEHSTFAPSPMTATTPVRIDVWTDSDGFVRRMRWERYEPENVQEPVTDPPLPRQRDGRRDVVDIYVTDLEPSPLRAPDPEMVIAYDLPPGIPSEIPSESPPENVQEFMPSPWPTAPHPDGVPTGFPDHFPMPAGAELVSSAVTDDGLYTVHVRVPTEGSDDVRRRIDALYDRGGLERPWTWLGGQEANDGSGETPDVEGFWTEDRKWAGHVETRQAKGAPYVDVTIVFGRF